jgi:hypothetical protein
VTLNGTTGVTTTTSFAWINRMQVTAVGSGGVNAGIITATVDSAEIATILAGEGQTQQAVYCVPAANVAGQEAYLTQLTVSTGRSSGTDSVVVELVRQQPGESKRVQANYVLQTTGSSSIQRSFSPPINFNAGALIWLEVAAVTANNLQVSGEFDVVWV